MTLFCVIIEWGKTLCCLIKQIIIFFQKQQTARKFEDKGPENKPDKDKEPKPWEWDRVQNKMKDQMVRHFMLLHYVIIVVTLCHNCRI